MKVCLYRCQKDGRECCEVKRLRRERHGLTPQQRETQAECRRKLKQRNYRHVSVELYPVRDEKTGVVSLKAVERGTTLRLHADRRIRLTLERIQHEGKGRGARRRLEQRT